MKVCFVVTEFFGWGRFGGFGRLSRTIATNLARRGIETYVLMPRYSSEPNHAIIDGVELFTFPPNIITRLGIKKDTEKLAKQIDADIYHGEQPSTWNFYCQNVKTAKHFITFQDPTFTEDWKTWRKSPCYWASEGAPPLKVSKFHRWFTANAMESMYNWIEMIAVRRADLICSQTKYHIPLIRKYYDLQYDPIFLPNPIEVPQYKIKKSDEPAVLFLARWDMVKRPWIFFKIARKMPKVHFICAGKSKDQILDARLRDIATNIPNLECPGHIDPIEALEKSWILINCSFKESLPMSFLEACAYKCAIVSCNDPDGFASHFGVLVQNGENVNEYVAALNSLISDENNLAALGQSAYDYVKKTHQLDTVINKHLEIYKRLLN